MRKRTIGAYFAIVFGIAIPIALFEIWFDPFRTGSAGGFCFLAKKLDIPVLSRVVGDCMATPYHLILFLIIVPILCGITVWRVEGRAIHGILAKLAFFIACQLGVMVAEDASWFTLNTIFQLRVPDALPHLLRGQVAWFPRWFDFGIFKLPDFYIYLPLSIVILLVIEHVANRKAKLVRPSVLS